MKTSRRNRISGATLIEAVLVLVIMSGIIVMGMRAYQGLSSDSQAQQVRANVESIIRAAANYYYANCKDMTDLNSGTLDPGHNPKADSPYVVTVTNLIADGFLMKAPPKNPLVNSTAANGGYVVQFVKHESIREYEGDPIGINYNWTIQVSVLLADVNAANRLLRMTGADCLTSAAGVGPNTSMVTCLNSASIPAGSKNYLSWERLPSMASPQGQSVLWLSNPVVKQFSQGSSTSGSIGDLIADPTTYYLCGS